MAQRTLCDGCGVQEGDGSFTRYGIMTPLDYCDTCAPFVEKYLNERDELHEVICRQFEEGLALIKTQIVESHPNLRLPDDF